MCVYFGKEDYVLLKFLTVIFVFGCLYRFMVEINSICFYEVDKYDFLNWCITTYCLLQ